MPDQLSPCTHWITHACREQNLQAEPSTQDFSTVNIWKKQETLKTGNILPPWSQRSHPHKPDPLPTVAQWAGERNRRRSHIWFSSFIWHKEGKRRSARSPTLLQEEVHEDGVHQALILPGSLSGTGNWFTVILHPFCQSEKVTTVPSLPICQGSTG
jgi:hypothetical protein